MQGRIAPMVALLVAVAGLAGCALNEAPDVGAAAGSSGATERTHQDARVVANVMRADLEPLAGFGGICESSLTIGATCLEAVRSAQGATSAALADLSVVRIPATMKTDADTLTSALQRTAKACSPLLAQPGRIGAAYAANEFDTSVTHLLTALSKIESDGQ